MFGLGLDYGLGFSSDIRLRQDPQLRVSYLATTMIKREQKSSQVFSLTVVDAMVSFDSMPLALTCDGLWWLALAFD